jgi:hypothetical protein
MRREELRRRLEELYRLYDHRFVNPDPLEFVRAQTSDADREVAGLVASGLAFGTVAQIKRSVATVLETVGPRPAEAVAALDARETAARLRAFRHRWIDGRDVACLLFFVGQMRRSHGSVETFFAEGLSPGDSDVGPASRPSGPRALSTTAGSTAAAASRPTPGFAPSSPRPRRGAPASGSTCTCAGWLAATGSTSGSGGARTRPSSSCPSTLTRSRSRAASG